MIGTAPWPAQVMGCAASSTASTVASPAVEPQLLADAELQQQKPGSRESAPCSRPSSPLECVAPVRVANMKIVGLPDVAAAGTPEAAAAGKELVAAAAPKNSIASNKGSDTYASAPADVACAILAFVGWKDRAALMGLNKHWRDNVFGDDTSWKAMCSFLHREECVYSAQSVCVSASWKALFRELWPLRSRWVKVEPADDKTVYSAAELLTRERAGETGLTIKPGWMKEEETYDFNISVVVRMRPQRDGADDNQEDAEEVVLPLHQRVALIRKQKGCSKEEAFQHLFGKTVGDFFDGATIEEESDAATEPAAVEAPVAPTEAKAETTQDAAKKTNAEPTNTAAGVVSVEPKEIVMCAPGVGLRPFTCFDSVLSDSASQAAVYETTARKQVADFINGLNCTIFCYGQTGSGKTHTLFGKDTDAATTLVKTTADAGVVPRACAEVAKAVAMRQKFMDACQLQLSYVEVYGEDVSDLLKDDKKSVGAWRGTAVRAVLDGTTRVTVTNTEHMQELLLQGEGAKRRAATAMNSRSSRAHALLILTLKQNSGGVESESHLCLADLGGSEQLKKSGVTGVRLKETIGINTGLLALKQCIRALNEKHTHIPYMDSKLTELLSSALGGNSKTTVIVTASPESRHASESLQALRFGEACAVVTNAADAQQSSVAHLIAELDSKIVATEALIEKNERWERWEETMPMDEFGDGGGIRTRMKLVGAEEEHTVLEECLKKRRQLLGEPEPDAAAVAEKKAEDVAKAAGKPDFEKVPEAAPLADGLKESEAAFRDQFDKNSANHHGGDDTPAAEPEEKQETPQEKKVRLMKEKRERMAAVRMEKMQKEKEDRRAALLAKAKGREERAAKKKAEMLEATKEKARKQQERLKRQMEMTRKAREQSSGFMETELTQVQTELDESIRESGADSEASVALAAKAEELRQGIKMYLSRTDKAVGNVQQRVLAAQDEAAIFSRSTRLASAGFAADADGWQTDLKDAAAGGQQTTGRSSLSEQERMMIEQHRKGQVLASDQALKTGEKLEKTLSGGSSKETPAAAAATDEAPARVESPTNRQLDDEMAAAAAPVKTLKSAAEAKAEFDSALRAFNAPVEEAPGGTTIVVPSKGGRGVAGAVATGWQAVAPLEQRSNEHQLLRPTGGIPNAPGGGMPSLSEE